MKLDYRENKRWTSLDGCVKQIKNTEVNYIPASINGQRLAKFTYLGSTLPRAAHIEDVVTARTAKTSVAFARLRGYIW